MDKIEIPFGAYDSETLGWTYTIPKGYIAKIEDGKIVMKKEELEDEKIKKSLVKFLKSLPIKHRCEYAASELENWLSWLEKQKEQKVNIDKLRRDIYQSGYNDGYQHGKEDAQKEQKPAEWSEEDKGILLSVKCVIDEVWHSKNNRTDYSTNELEEMWHWLDTLWQRVEYQQPSWKPSEEQMEALEHFIRSWGESGTMGPQNTIFCAAKSLYANLQKLL